jgi:4a-hydroxytetrahydrobiopterin dehydratase
MARLTEDEIRERVALLRGWERSGGQIRKTYPFASFAEGMAFADRVAALAEARTCSSSTSR